MFVPETMNDQINHAENLEISYRTLHTKAIVHDSERNINIRIPYDSLINKYRHFLESIVIEIKIDETYQKYYRYKPKLFSNDTYGTTELWFVILELNGCPSMLDFDLDRIKIYDPKKFKSFINEIMNLEGILY